MRILLFFAALLAAPLTSWGYDVHLFPAPTTHDFDLEVFHERLGIDGHDAIIEDFEDRTLIPGLGISVPLMSWNSKLPWDGKHAAGPFSEVEFKIREDNVRLFGVGIGNNDGGGEWISINEQRKFRLSQMPYYLSHGGGMAYYVLIKAGRDDPPIQSVRFGNGFTMEFDHVILVRPDRTDDDRFVFSLTDGSEIIGRIPGGVVSVLLPTTGSILEIPDSRIRSIETVEEGGDLILSLENGDLVSGNAKLSYWDVDSILGQLKINRNLVRSIESFEVFKDLIEPLALARRKIPKDTVFPPSGFVRGGAGLRVEFPTLDRERPGVADRIWKLRSRDERDKSELTQILSDGSRPIAHRRIALCALGSLGITDEETVKQIDAKLTRQRVELPVATDLALKNENFSDEPLRLTGYGERICRSGSGDLSGWSVVNGTVNLRRLRGGDRSMVLELGPDSIPGGVGQVFRTETNKVYRVAIMACQGTDGNRNTQAVIKVGNLEKVFDCPPGQNLERFEFEFQAISTLTTLVLEGVGNSGYGPMIGRVDIFPGNQ